MPTKSLSNLQCKEIKLGNLFSLRSGRLPIKDNEIITFLGMEDLSIDGKIINQHLMHYRDLKPGLTYFEKGDVLVAKITPCFENGKGAYLNKLLTKKGFGSTEFHVLVANYNSVPEYIYYHTQSSKFRNKLTSEMIGTAGHKRVPVISIINYKIPCFHSKAEQIAIAKALGDINLLIEAINALINKKRQIEKGVTRQLLTGKIRVSGSNLQSSKQQFKETEIGLIPSEWSINKIGNLCIISTGNKNTQDKMDGGLYPFFVRSQEVERINSYSFDGEAVLTAGDGVGTGKIFHYINGKFDFHQRVYKLSNFNHHLDGYFFYKYFSNNFYTRISSLTAKSSVDSIRMEAISEMMIPLPSCQEQKIIAMTLKEIDNEITFLEEKREKIRFIKLGMMQQLLTGKTRLL